MSLFSELNKFKDSEIASTLSKRYDFSKENNDKVITAIFYAFISDLIRRSNSSMSSSLLYKQIKVQNEKINKLGDLEEVVKDDLSYNAALKLGGKNNSLIFPGMKSPLIKLVSSYAKTPKQTNVDYTYFSTLYITKAMGQIIEKNGMDIGDWALYLRNHHNELFNGEHNDLINKMTPILGLQELRKQKQSTSKEDLKESYVSKIEETSREEPVPTESTFEYEENTGDSSAKKIFLGLLTAAILGAIAYFGYQNKDLLLGTKSAAETETSVVIPEVDSVGLANELTLADTISTIKKLDEYMISSEAKGKKFTVSEFAFEDGSIDMPEQSIEFTKELIDLFEKYPSLQVKIEGFDANGDSKLGLKRAFALKKQLINADVSNLRIDAGAGGKGPNNLDLVVVFK